jgi:hypothetical protein
MSVRTAPLSTCTILSLTFAGLLTATLFAQQPKVLAPHKPVAPTVTPLPNWHFREPTQRSMVGGFWTIDANFKSTLYIKNGVKNAGIKVTPIAYLSNGKSYTFGEVSLDPSGTAVVSINDELGKQGIASWATLSGYLEVRYNHAWDAICVTLQDVDVAHSLIFTYKLQPAPSLTARPQAPAPTTPETQMVEGMWWKQESNVTGFVALSNVLAESVSASIIVTDNQGRPMKRRTVTVSPHGTKLVKFDELQFSPNAEGGISVAYQGPKDGLLINGGLEDPGNGYSATIRFYPAAALQAQAPTHGYAELGLMAGAADPMMLFPAGTVFAPYSIVRNVTAQPIGITPVLWWMEAGTPRSALLPRFGLPSHATQTLPVEAMLAQAGLKNFNGSFNLILEADARLGGLLLTSGSVDQSNTYVFEVFPQGTGESASKSLSYWSTGKGDDTMITIWNPADEAQDFVFTLFFSGGSYKYPIPLGPRVTRTFNVSEIVHSQIPDVDGNLVPLTVHEGSAEISGSRGETEQIMVGVTAGIYNVQKATCGNPCSTCNGITETELQLSSFTLSVGGTTKESLIATFNTGSKQDYSSEATWSSYNTSILTLKNPGTATGVSPGSSYAHAITAAEFAAYDSCITSGQCPVEQVAATCPGTVECPSSTALSSLTPLSITLLFPGIKTGIGAVASMEVGPTTTDWDGAQITEAVTTTSNSCPATWGNLCSGSSTFTVGEGGQAEVLVNGVETEVGPVFTAQQNIFYDQHTIVSNASLLPTSSGKTSCTAVCTQTYSCNGTSVGSHTITYSFIEALISGTHVTSTEVSEQ